MAENHIVIMVMNIRNHIVIMKMKSGNHKRNETEYERKQIDVQIRRTS